MSKGHLELHIRSAHEPVNCSVCVKNFPNKKVLKKHMEKVHEGKSIKTEPGQAATVKTEPVKGTCLSESTNVFVITPNRRTFFFPETKNLNSCN